MRKKALSLHCSLDSFKHVPLGAMKHDRAGCLLLLNPIPLLLTLHSPFIAYRLVFSPPESCRRSIEGRSDD